MRIGNGYDVHPLVVGRKLVLGGVAIPFERGLDGWSDADVCTHALMDALLGAAALGDIGQHFPPGEAAYKGVSSVALLERVTALLAARGCHVINTDVTIVAEKPRLWEYIKDMRKALANAMGIDVAKVSVKASTNNGLGFLGEAKGIAAYAVALIEEGK
jgi:2-C-methyl-D-erythritol 2,4-cyclodiphosphate synthase